MIAKRYISKSSVSCENRDRVQGLTKKNLKKERYLKKILENSGFFRGSPYFFLLGVAWWSSPLLSCVVVQGFPQVLRTSGGSSKFDEGFK